MKYRIIATIGITALLLWLFPLGLAWWGILISAVVMFLLIEYALSISPRRPLVALAVALGIIVALWMLRPTPVITSGGTVCNDGTISYSTGPGTCSYHGGVRSGTVCNDGWVSPSTGPGTCSHHGGVRK